MPELRPKPCYGIARYYSRTLALHYARALLPSSALHGAKPRVQEMLGLGVWGKGVPRLGTLKHACVF